MSKSDRERDAYPVDPNFAGAFAGGPPLLSEEEARRLLEQPEQVENEIQERWRRVLEARAKAAITSAK